MHPFPVETSVFAGVALATILMFKWELRVLMNGMAFSTKVQQIQVLPSLNTAIVVGFGGVVKNTQGL